MQQQGECRRNILLIGDSITMGYTHAVRRELKDIANVYDTGENCRFSQYILSSLQFWADALRDVRIDAIHMNCGQWDASHFGGGAQSLNTVEQYAENLKRIIWLCAVLFPGAKIFFATTTPMNPVGISCTNPRTTEEIQGFNRQGLVPVADAHGIPVNDLFALVKDWPASCYCDYAHFTPEAYNTIGKAVADFLRAQLADEKTMRL